MQLVVTCPNEWKAVSNGIETVYDYSKGEQGKRVIEKHAIEHFLEFYDTE